MSGPPLLEARGLRKAYPLGPGLFRSGKGQIGALRGVSFAILEGESVALVGESGSGKSTVGRLLVGLESPSGGEVFFRGRPLSSLSSEETARFRREVQIVFQDPFGSLNPRIPVGRAIAEALAVHRIARGRGAAERTGELLRLVGLKEADGDRYPHEFSGGQRQRVCIARALAVEPRFLVADEPVSSLDVSIQAQIVHLLLELRAQLGLGYLVISHNLGIVGQLAERVLVLYLGQVVEEGPTRSVFPTPLHPYTKALIEAIPRPDPARRGERRLLKGDVPSSSAPPAGCPFHPRCPEVMDRCRREASPWWEPTPGHRATCHLHDRLASRNLAG